MIVDGRGRGILGTLGHLSVTSLPCREKKRLAAFLASMTGQTIDDCWRDT